MVGERRDGGRGDRVMRSAAVSLMAVAGMGLAGPMAQAATPAQDLPLELVRADGGNGGASCLADGPGPEPATPAECESGGGTIGRTAPGPNSPGTELCVGGDRDGAEIDRSVMEQMMEQVLSDRNVKADVTPVDWGR